MPDVCDTIRKQEALNRPLKIVWSAEKAGPFRSRIPDVGAAFNDTAVKPSRCVCVVSSRVSLGWKQQSDSENRYVCRVSDRLSVIKRAAHTYAVLVAWVACSLVTSAWMVTGSLPKSSLVTRAWWSEVCCRSNLRVFRVMLWKPRKAV